MCFFFFFKQKTAYEMRISDWSSDVCSSDLVAGELYNEKTGSSLTHVPYKGAGDAMNDLLAGRVHIYMNNIPSFIAHVGTGAVRPLALAAKKRSELLPDVPTTDRKSTRLNSSH